MASHGIHKVVDTYADLPDAARLDLDTVYLVRQDTDAPNGAGLYWVRKGSAGREWVYLDNLSLQRADEVPYDAAASGLSAENVQQAVDQLAEGGGGGPIETHTIHVDPVLGVDEPGRGQLGKPYRTVNYAYAQAPVVASGLETVEGQREWATEKLIFDLAPGEYDEDVVLGFRRARVMLRGEGVRILGSITQQALIADFPTAYSGSQAGWTDNPFPWTDSFVSPTLELCGIGGGMEGGHVTQNLLVQDSVRIVFETGIGSWQDRVGVFYAMINHAILKGGFHATDDGAGGTFVAPSLTVEINDSAIEGGILGAVRSSAASSSVNLILKATNSQLKSVIGPVCNIFEVDNCRFRNLDRTADETGETGQITYGDVQSQTSSAYTGITNCGFEGTVCAIGNSSATRSFRLDAASWSNLQARGGITDRGAGITLILADVAAGIAYDGTTDQTGIWDGDAPADLQEAVQRMAVALQEQIGAVIP